MAFSRSLILLCVTAAMAACSPPSQEAVETRAATPPRRTAPPCPAEQLSCGLQTPVRSDGAQPFENREMGLRTLFPEGSQVCLARSGDAVRGFFAHYGGGPPGCLEKRERPPRFITLYASWNSVSHLTIEKGVHECRPLPTALRKQLGELSFPGVHSILCNGAEGDQAIEVLVYALAGTGMDDGSSAAPAPAIEYFAAFGTAPEHLAEDLPRFRAVLANTEIGLPTG